MELYTKITPILSILLNITSAIVYLISGDPKHFIYWIAAATLTACVTF